MYADQNRMLNSEAPDEDWWAWGKRQEVAWNMRTRVIVIIMKKAQAVLAVFAVLGLWVLFDFKNESEKQKVSSKTFDAKQQSRILALSIII